MADRSTHVELAIWGAVIAFSVLVWSIGPGLSAIVALACVVGEAVMGPDRDRPTLITWRSPLSAYWRPFARLVSHRGPLSHWPVVSTAVRAAYMALPVVVAMVLSGVDLEAFALQHAEILWCAGGGLEASTWLHGLADIKRD